MWRTARCRAGLLAYLAAGAGACAHRPPPLPDPPALERAVGPWVQTPGGLAFRGEVWIAEDPQRTLWVEVAAANRTRRSIRWEHGVCTPRLRAYASPERTGVPVWQSPPEACALEAVLIRVAPGRIIDPFQRRPVAPAARILGSPPLPGPLYFTIVSPLRDFPELPVGDLRPERKTEARR